MFSSVKKSRYIMIRVISKSKSLDFQQFDFNSSYSEIDNLELNSKLNYTMVRYISKGKSLDSQHFNFNSSYLEYGDLVSI